MNQTKPTCSSKPTLTGVMIGVLILWLSGCNPASQSATGDRPTATASSPQASVSVSPSVTASSQPSNQPLTTSPNSASATPTPAADTVAVTIYQVDDQCETLVPETVTVAEDRPMEGAIAKVLEGQSNSDFKLSGYRISINDGVATVDLRLSPDSRRKFISLSSCEQLALFGSIEETLTQNSQWQVKSVRFTERGENLVL